MTKEEWKDLVGDDSEWGTKTVGCLHEAAHAYAQHLAVGLCKQYPEGTNKDCVLVVRIRNCQSLGVFESYDAFAASVRRDDDHPYVVLSLWGEPLSDRVPHR